MLCASLNKTLYLILHTNFTLKSLLYTYFIAPDLKCLTSTPMHAPTYTERERERERERQRERETDRERENYKVYSYEF